MKKNSWSKTKITDLLVIKYPIIQGPFGGGLSSVTLTSTVSNLGGLGSFGCQHYTATEILEFNRSIRNQTNNPFNLNLWVNDRDEQLVNFDAAAFKKLKEIFTPYLDGTEFPLPEIPRDLGPKYEDQLEAIIKIKPPVFSFMFGIPDENVLETFRRNGTKTIGTATTVEEAIALENAGVDAVVATGFEAGGHRASFMSSPENSLTGTFALLPQVADSISIPIIAAGGIADERGIKAAFALGADAVQIGTAFLATSQSNAIPEHREKLFSNDAKYSTLTKMLTGRLSRVVRNRLTIELKNSEHLFAPYPLQRILMSSLVRTFLKNHKPEYNIFSSGQSAPLIKYRDASEFFCSLVDAMDRNSC